MTNVRWRAIIGILMALAFSKITHAGNTTNATYWYLNGIKQTWQAETDKAVLQVAGHADFKSLPQSPTVKYSDVEVIGNNTYLHLSLSDDADARNMYVNYLQKQYPGSRLVLSFRDEQGKEQLVDNKVFVSFKGYMSDADVASFAARWNLTLENPKPADMPIGWKYVYIFHQNEFSTTNNTLVVSSKICEQENALVDFANPNRVSMPGQGFAPNGSLNDSDLDYAWYLGNHGQRVVCAANGGTAGDDAKVIDAWTTGFTGQGIRVGVIDFGGFDYNHADMQGQILAGWNCIDNSPYDASNATYDAAYGGHAMAVSGIIAAKGNNGLGSAGVSYDAKIVPFLVNGQEDAQLVIAMQKAVDPAFNVDVLNFSLGIDHPSDAIRTQIENLAVAGRVRYGNALGVVMVASHGNNGSFDGTSPQWPAAYPQVISVGASTPDDKLKTTGDSWNLGSTAWASNYGNNMSVVAPGVCIYTTDMSGSQGYASGDYGAFSKTSAAAPIVSGVAALILSKNGSLTCAEVKDLINNTADKVHTDIYNYNEDNTMPGHCKEMGYGRINAYKALSNIATGIGTTPTATKNSFLLNNPVQNDLIIRYKLVDNTSDVSVQLFDMSGRLLRTRVLGRNEEMVTIDVDDYSPGMYFARFFNKEDELLQSVKFVKLW